jgi:hypothetical protein
MDKGFLFSDVLEKLDTYEKKSAAQVLYMQAGEAIRFDVEAAISRPTTSKPENATAARMAGVESFLITNTSRVAGGANGGYNSTTKIVNAPTDATVGLRNGTTIEKDITDVLEKIADSSGSATGVNIHLGLKLRGEFSRRVSGRGTLTQNFDAKKQGGITVTGSIKYFESDYGFHAVMLNQRQRGRSIMLLNDDFLELPVLEEMDIITEGKQGHATRKFYKWQGSLKVLNERAHGIVADYDSVLFGDSVGTTK